MILRNRFPSSLKNLIAPLILPTHTYTRPVSNSFHSAIFDPLPTFENSIKTHPFFLFTRHFSSQDVNKIQSFSHQPMTRDGNYDETTSQTFSICPGCGVRMQNSDTKQPGFFANASTKSPNYKKFSKCNPIDDESEISDSLKRGVLNGIIDVKAPENLGTQDQFSDDKTKRPTVCSRCHSLRYYGKVKDPSVENLLPDFDFDHTVGRRLMSTSGGRTVILLVVDATDFDGSFPQKVANLVSRTIEENSQSWKEGKSGNVPRVVLVVTKIDLLPSSVSPTGLDHWVRTRSREGGAPRLTSVHLVSAVKDWGVKNLVDDVVGLAGARGRVWAVGMQNAGKSTLINAIGKCVGVKNLIHLTEAPVAGTTLGIVRVEGVLPGKAKMFDTPGLINPHQISSRLTMEEQKLIHIGKELRPRTYRIKEGHSVHIAGLLRLDLEKSSVDSIYVTVWASLMLPLHMGKTEKASTMLEEHFGRQLQPPIGEGRVEELGKWVKREFHVSGNMWDSSSVDIAASGLGWYSIGLKGEAILGVWTYEGVDVILRNALITRRSRYFEVAGFTVSEIVSKADQSMSKKRRNEKKKKQGNSTIESHAISSPLIINLESNLENS